MNNDPNMRDLWTRSTGYHRAYQNKQQVEAILNLLQLDDAAGLIDIGCGNGAFAIEAARRYPKCKVWACDPLESAVNECRSRAAELAGCNFEVFVASAESVPLADTSADRILMRNTLHHVPDANAAFAEIGRLLRRDGRLVLEGPCNAWDDDTGKLLTAIHMLMDDSHERTYLRPETIVTALERYGLHTKHVDSWSYPFSVGEEQSALIRQHNAQDKFRLHQRDDNRWFVEFKIARIIATNDLDQRGGRNEKKS